MLFVNFAAREEFAFLVKFVSRTEKSQGQTNMIYGVALKKGTTRKQCQPSDVTPLGESSSEHVSGLQYWPPGISSWVVAGPKASWVMIDHMGPPPMWTDRHPWKRYFPVASLAGGKNWPLNQLRWLYRATNDNILLIELFLKGWLTLFWVRRFRQPYRRVSSELPVRVHKLFSTCYERSRRYHKFCPLPSLVWNKKKIPQ